MHWRDVLWFLLALASWLMLLVFRRKMTDAVVRYIIRSDRKER